jgi:hypothetical protein
MISARHPVSCAIHRKWVILMAAGLFGGFGTVRSQSLSPQVGAPSGSSGSGGGVQLAWTVGQPVTVTLTGGAGMLTQGFHQTYLSNDLLPIVLVDFAAARTGADVELKWVTLREWNNEYFTVERSTDGVHFQAVLRIDGAGTSARPLRYQCLDPGAPSGAVYYRLRQTDFDGASTLSSVLRIDAFTQQGNWTVGVYPNPVREEASLRLSPGAPEEYQATLLDMSGRELRTERMDAQRQSLSLRGLPGGIYMLRINTLSGDMRSIRIVKQD